MSVALTVLVVLLATPISYSQFLDCQVDPSMEPEDGPLTELQFTWLGTLQYIHVKNGTPHYFRVPRVVLITRQFSLSTAVDAAEIPDGYALGNIAFGEYERDEAECQLTLEDLAGGAKCDPAILLMPIADVLLHPEYKHFGAKNSIAILKLITPIKSAYMLPVCLPFKNHLMMKNGRQTTDRLVHVDFSSDVPRDFIEEAKDVTRIRLLPREVCFIYDNPENSTGKVPRRIACTTGCGFHSGAPSLIHEHTGHWTMVALSQGGFPCPDPLRVRRPPPPPRHILIHPYVPWITAAITGQAVGAFDKNDPFGFMMPRASAHDDPKYQDYVGHWWMGGVRCYDRGEKADDVYKFYHEIFSVKPSTFTHMSYYLEIDAPRQYVIVCVKVGMPYKAGKPRVWELYTPIVKVRIPFVTFSDQYMLQVEAWVVNSTSVVETEEDESYSEEEEEEEDDEYGH